VSPGVAQRLQSAAGNRAVSGLLARRAATAPTRPGASPTGPDPAAPATPATAPGSAVAPASSAAPAGDLSVQRFAPGAPPGAAGGRSPASDPKFAALTADVRGKQQHLAVHRPAKAEADAAAGAAVPPQDDKLAQGKTVNAAKMDAAKPGEFDKAAFVRAVNDAIAKQAPKNLDEADSFAGSGKADAVKGEVAGKVGEGKKASAGPIEQTTQAPPDTSAAKDKPVTPLAPDQPPPTPATPDPAKAVPDPAPPAATDLSAGPKQVEAQLAEAEVTEPQLANANEPAFADAVAAKKEGEAHAATAPGQLRASEARTLAGARAQAGQAGAAAMTAMTADRKATGAAVGGGKTEAKGSDEAKRAQATATLQKVFDATKTEVEAILTGLDRKVDEKFTAEEGAARAAFTAEHKRRMDEYKDRRYSGLLGAGRWLKDKFAGLPEEANQIFVTARAGYVTRMQQVISSVADLIGAELGRAKQRIAKGRADLQAEVARLPKDLQAVGRQAAGEFAGKFDELTEAVTSKGQELVQTLAGRYTEALGKVDEEITAEKEKNKGLVAKAMDAVGGVIKTILELKSLLLGVLAKAASAVMAIIKDPIGFLGKLVSAVGAGLHAFIANIGEHLKKGLLGWLLGAMASAGLQLPGKFDLRGIISMIASLLGLTWGAIRGRVVSRGVPEQAMGAVEQSVPVAQKLQSEGVAGIWQQIAAKVGDLKANLFSKISKFLIPTVLIAGITWLVSLLNPASAFIKACKMIIDIVTFIVERGAQIVAFVNAVLDAVIAIAGGGTGGVPALIEKALAMSIPVLIGALAAILGIGGIAEKVKKFFQALAKPVMKAVDWVVDKIVKFGKKIWAKLKSKFGKKGKKGAKSPEEDVKDRWQRGLKEIRGISARSHQGGLTTEQLHAALAATKSKYGFQEVYAHRKGEGWAVYAKLNPDNKDSLIPITGKVLLIGEGNLTFTEANLILGRTIPGNVRATVYKKKEQVKDTATQARADKLQEQGVTVEFGVDATKLHEEQEQTKYDSIIWLFPHPGGPRSQAAAGGAALLVSFFASASQRLAPGGRISVTLRVAKNPMWYVSRWRPVEAAAAAGLRMVSQSGFEQSDYPGYTHETTDERAIEADVSRGVTFVFTQ
jgi:Skp family chaperone for outer membrane proteins